MLEISPVLAGTFDSSDYAPAVNNLGNAPSTNDTSSIDGRRYTQFDRTSSDVGNAEMSFDDFLDMINPLEHIPVVSSVYRAITDEKINPVSRIVGDLMYGGVTGVATAVMGVVGAIGDSVMEASTGKDATGNVLASLFGSDKKTDDTTPDTQLATAATPAVAAVQMPAPSASPPAPVASSTSPQMTPAAAALASIASMSPTNGGPTFVPSSDAQTQALVAAKSFPLDPKKIPFGGVMDPGLLQGSNMALSMAASAPGVQINHMVYPGGLGKGTKPSSVLSASATPPASSTDVSAANTTNTGTIPGTTAANPLPPQLMKELASLRAINQYKNTASQTAPAAGASVDVVN